MKASQPNLFSELALFNALPDPYLLISPDFKIEGVNDCYLLTFTEQREGLLGKELKDVFTNVLIRQGSSLAKVLEQSIYKVLTTKETDKQLIELSDQQLLTDPADKYRKRYWKLISTPLLNEQGTLQSILLKIEDVTPLLNLTQQEDYLQQTFSGQSKAIEILNTLHAIFIELDHQYRYLYINEKAEQYLGKSKEALIGKIMWEEFPQAVGSAGYHAIVKASQERIKVETEYLSAVYHKWIFISVVPSPAGVIIFMYDREETKQAQGQLEEEHRRLKEAQSIGHIGSFEWQLDSKLTYWSDELYRIHGLEPQSEEITFQRVTSFIHPQDRQILQKLQAQSMEKAGHYQLVHRIIIPSGELKWVNHQFESIANNEERVIRVRGTLQDITDQKLIQLQMQQQAKNLAIANQSIKATHEELLCSHKALGATNQQLVDSQQALKQLNEGLEEIVNQRTSQLQLAQQEAVAQKERLYSLFMQAPGAICILEGPDLVFALVNPGFEGLFPGRKLLGRPVTEALSEISEQVVLPILQRVFEKGETFEGKEMLISFARQEKEPTQERYFNFIYQARRNPIGEVDGVMVFAYEVTEQVLARRKVEASRLRFKILSESIPQLVWTATVEGKINYFNSQWYRYSGLTKEQSVGQGWTEVIHPQDRPAIQREWQQALQTGKPYEKEARLKGFKGSYRWFLIRALPLKDKQGYIQGWFGTSTDIDQQKLLAQQLHQMSDKLAATNWKLQGANHELKEVNDRLTRTNEDLDNFVYTASHDLRSPINSMEGLLKLLKQALQDKLEPNEQILMEHLLTSMQKLNRTIIDLTEIVKISKDTDQEAEAISLEELLAEVTDDIAPLLAAAQGELIREWQIEYIRYPRKVLRSVFYNLLSNAFKYRHPKRQAKVHIRTEQLGKHMRLIVEDNGLGLTPEQIKKLFQMFGRLHTHVEGTGIGLYMIKRMIENYGGTISVESTLGQGTTFYVNLPYN